MRIPIKLRVSEEKVKPDEKIAVCELGVKIFLFRELSIEQNISCSLLYLHQTTMTSYS
jgi:hypothetical protein